MTDVDDPWVVEGSAFPVNGCARAKLEYRRELTISCGAAIGVAQVAARHFGYEGPIEMRIGNAREVKPAPRRQAYQVICS